MKVGDKLKLCIRQDSRAANSGGELEKHVSGKVEELHTFCGIADGCRIPGMLQLLGTGKDYGMSWADKALKKNNLQKQIDNAMRDPRYKKAQQKHDMKVFCVYCLISADFLSRQEKYGPSV